VVLVLLEPLAQLGRQVLQVQVGKQFLVERVIQLLVLELTVIFI
tara:strand:+ start:190 stop:321 length:132 start_codon:yes stop_codon:yes gene_type:complete